jgi:hypothetical protein
MIRDFLQFFYIFLCITMIAVITFFTTGQDSASSMNTPLLNNLVGTKDRSAILNSFIIIFFICYIVVTYLLNTFYRVI